MKKRNKDREISVRAPDYIPRKAAIFKDTTGTEALDVFKVAEAVGRVLSVVMIGVGIFVAVMSGYSVATSANMFLNPLFIGLLGLVGALNIFSGLLLLAKK